MDEGCCVVGKKTATTAADEEDDGDGNLTNNGKNTFALLEWTRRSDLEWPMEGKTFPGAA